MNASLVTNALRILAIAIAVAGAIDPSLSVNDVTRPEVAVVSSPRLPDSQLSDRVAAALADRFDVLRDNPFGPAAVVAVGDSLPAPAQRSAPVAFAVTPIATEPFVTITDLQSPPRASAHAQVIVRAVIRSVAAANREVVVSLRVNDREIDRQTIKVATNDQHEGVLLTLPSGVTGPQPFTVVATVADSVHGVDGTVTIHDGSWQVLSLDRRPSWASGFIRRALETDPRFTIVARVATSRGVSSSIGDAPAALSAADLERFDTVIVSGLEALSAADIAGLDAFMRERGGSVILLPDDPESPAALRQLSGIERWSASAANDPSGVPLASEVIAPASTPVWATVRADRSVRISAGSGELVVAGAMDAWRYRQRDAAAFDRYWQVTVAESAERGQSRGATTLPAPTGAGRRPVPQEPTLVASWTGAHGGKVFPSTELAQLPDALRAAISPSVERRTIHPMRSGWWMAPFGLLLGLEWWTRRRRGEK